MNVRMLYVVVEVAGKIVDSYVYNFVTQLFVIFCDSPF
jgi:hypothetical protein